MPCLYVFVLCAFNRKGMPVCLSIFLCACVQILTGIYDARIFFFKADIYKMILSICLYEPNIRYTVYEEWIDKQSKKQQQQQIFDMFVYGRELQPNFYWIGFGLNFVHIVKSCLLFSIFFLEHSRSISLIFENHCFAIMIIESNRNCASRTYQSQIFKQNKHFVVEQNETFRRYI